MRKLCLKHGTYDELKTCKWVIPEEDLEEAVEVLRSSLRIRSNSRKVNEFKDYMLKRFDEEFGKEEKGCKK